MFQRVAYLFIGLLLFGMGIVKTIRRNLGTGPWDVLHMGMINYFPFSVGQVSQLTGILVIGLGLALRIRPGFE